MAFDKFQKTRLVVMGAMVAAKTSSFCNLVTPNDMVALRTRGRANLHDPDGSFLKYADARYKSVVADNYLATLKEAEKKRQANLLELMKAH